MSQCPRCGCSADRIGGFCSRECEKLGALTNRKALLVDDDPSMLEYLTGLLRERGYDEVRTAHNGRAALELLIASPDFLPVVILSDYDMPLLNGTELHSQLRQTFPALEPRFIVVSGSSKPQRYCRENTVPFVVKGGYGFEESLDQAIKDVLP